MMQPTSSELDAVAASIRRNITMKERPNGSAILRLERRLVRKLKPLFASQLAFCLVVARKLYDSRGQNSIRTNTLDDDISLALDEMPGKEKMSEEIVAAMKVSLDKGARTITRDLSLAKFGVSFSLINAEAKKFLDAKKSLELSNFRGNITDTTKKHILTILRDALTSGQSYEVTSTQIQEQGDAGVFSQARGELIATREIGIAYEVGNNIPIEQFQALNPDRLVYKFWQTVEDERVTEKHRQNQANGWILFSETFSGTGDQRAPGSDNPRCRCFTKYEIR